MDVRLIISRGAKRRQTFQMPQKELIIGRRSGSGLRIPSAQVSRQHCRLYKQDGVLMLEDLNSINGTQLNNQLIEDPAIVRPGDSVQVGPVRFVVEYELSKAALHRLDSMGPPSSVEVLVEVDDEADDDLMTIENPEILEDLADGEAAELLPIDEEDEDAPAFELELEAIPEDEEAGDLEPVEGVEIVDGDEEDEDWSLPLEEDEAGAWSDADFEKSGPLDLADDEGYRDLLERLDDDDDK